MHRWLILTCVDLSKILDGQNKILGGQKVVKSDKCMGVSQLLGARARAALLKSTPMLIILSFPEAIHALFHFLNLFIYISRDSHFSSKKTCIKRPLSFIPPTSTPLFKHPRSSSNLVHQARLVMAQ